MVSLPVLRKRYPSAPYAFFDVMNYEQIRRAFLKNPTTNPAFTYPPSFNLKAIQQTRVQLAGIQKQIAASTAHGNELQFITKRLAEADLLIASLQLQAEPKSKVAYTAFRQAMCALYGDFDKSMFAGAINYLRLRSEAANTFHYFQAVEALLGDYDLAAELYRPQEKTFQHYKDVVMASEHPLKHFMLRKQNAQTPHDVMSVFAEALDDSGATAAGWHLRQNGSGANVRISRHKKQVTVGRYYLPHSLLRLQQIVAHEVIVHVRRTMLHDLHQSSEIEEGVALVVEQLLASRFSYKRLLRYLAAALAWGVDGNPRTFRETFDILWRACIIVGAHNQAEAKQRAFQECVRVFRGGLPAVAGAAYIKDKIYLEANLSVWRQLENDTLSKQAFLDLLDGQW